MSEIKTNKFKSAGKLQNWIEAKSSSRLTAKPEQAQAERIGKGKK